VKELKNCEEQSNSRLACDWLTSGQPAKGHVRSTCWKLKSQVPEGILRLGQLARWPTKCTGQVQKMGKHSLTFCIVATCNPLSLSCVLYV